MRGRHLEAAAIDERKVGQIEERADAKRAGPVFELSLRVVYDESHLHNCPRLNEGLSIVCPSNCARLALQEILNANS
jgi:hypothetical protein